MSHNNDTSDLAVYGNLSSYKYNGDKNTKSANKGCRELTDYGNLDKVSIHDHPLSRCSEKPTKPHDDSELAVYGNLFSHKYNGDRHTKSDNRGCKDLTDYAEAVKVTHH